MAKGSPKTKPAPTNGAAPAVGAATAPPEETSAKSQLVEGPPDAPTPSPSDALHAFHEAVTVQAIREAQSQAAACYATLRRALEGGGGGVEQVVAAGALLQVASMGVTGIYEGQREPTPEVLALFEEHSPDEVVSFLAATAD